MNNALPHESDLQKTESDLLAVDDALHSLEALYPRKARVVELRFFGRLSHRETAKMLNISTATAECEGGFARAWPNKELASYPGNRDSYQAAVSDDGRFVAFRSNATNLVADDTNELSDVFVHDTQSGVTERVSFDLTGAELTVGTVHPSISDDGRMVAMQSYITSFANIVVYDRQTGAGTLILQALSTDKEARQEPVMSGDGRFVAFHTRVGAFSNIPPVVPPLNDDINAAHDIIVYDLLGQTAERVSRDNNGILGNGDSFSPSLSDDGRYVAFYSFADNLVPDDTNDAEDVFVKDRQTAAVVRASVASDGTQGDGDSYTPAISGDAGYVAFRSLASNLVAGDTNGSWDIFVHDLQTSTTERVSVATDATQANDHSYAPSISDDGRFVVFRSNARNLVGDDTNNRWDIFLHDRQTATTTRVNLTASSQQGDLHSYEPVISGDGSTIVFGSEATNLVSGDTNGSQDIFLVLR